MTLSLSDKKRLTAYALERFCRELPAPNYDIRIVFPDGSAWPREWTRPQLQTAKTVGFLRARNMQGDAAIYIRPVSMRYVLVDFDDDGYERLRRMVEDGVPIRYAIETSPYHVQAWVFVGWKATVERQAELARSLAIQYGGDMGAAHEKQLGRAPGFYNRKPQYRNDVGHFPLVQQIPQRLEKLISEPRNEPPSVAVTPPPSLARRAARGAGAISIRTDDELEAWIDSIDASRETSWPSAVVCNGETVVDYSEVPDLGPARTAYARALECMADEGYKPRLRTDGQVDRSYQDFDVAAYVLACGYTEEFAAAAIACSSNKAAERSCKAKSNYAYSRVRSAMHKLRLLS